MSKTGDGEHRAGYSVMRISLLYKMDQRVEGDWRQRDQKNLTAKVQGRRKGGKKPLPGRQRLAVLVASRLPSSEGLGGGFTCMMQLIKGSSLGKNALVKNFTCA